MTTGRPAWFRADVSAAVALQRRLGHTPAVPAAKALSAFGEHALGWLALAGAGAVLDPGNRSTWVRSGGAVVAAHAGAVVAKRVVRRPRPALEELLVHSPTMSALSFPSSHAASTTAAAVSLVPVLGPALLPVALAMAAARVLLGVHYPTDVLAGAALGAAAGDVARRAARAS